jgi:hypothetical protein
MSHPFLTDKEHEDLKIFARIMHDRGGMEAITDDGFILLQMATNNIPKPTVQAGDKTSVVMFSDKEWSYLVAMWTRFEAQGDNGLGCLRVKRDYLMREFCPLGTFSQKRALKILMAMLCILHINPENIDFDFVNFGGFSNKLN